MNEPFLVRKVVAALWGVSLALIAHSLLGAEGRIQGQIINGTTERPAPDLKVILLVPREGMQQVGATTTDAAGRFAFTEEIDPNSLYLLQANFQGIPYRDRAQFDSSALATVNLRVYDVSEDESAVRIQLLQILARAQGSKIRVQEEYTIENRARPPRTFATPGGTFRFRVPSRAGQPSVAVTGLMKVPIPQAPEPGKSPGEFSIRHPLNPGSTVVTVAYEAEYSAAGFELGDSVLFPVERAEMYVFPSGLNVDSKLFKPAGVDSANGVERFEAANIARGAALQARISGEATPGAGPETGQDEQQIKVVPNSLTRLGVPLFFCFLLILLWALGVRVAKEWPQGKGGNARSPAHKQLAAQVETLLNSLVDLDELFASGKIFEKNYWKERLELKARLVAILKKSPPSLLESYAARHISR